MSKEFTPIGKRVKTEAGYIMVRCPDHPNANKGKNGAYAFEHRLVMAKHLGRAIKADEIIHHVNGDKSDNRIENLELLSNAEHMRMHGSNMGDAHRRAFLEGGRRYAEKRKIKRKYVLCACGCGGRLETPDSKGRKRSFIHGHNQKGKTWTWGGQQ